MIKSVELLMKSYLALVVTLIIITIKTLTNVRMVERGRTRGDLEFCGVFFGLWG